jgi:U3 small nucleolar RNA-associated protein 18
MSSTKLCLLKSNTDLPIHCAAMTSTGNEIIVSGRRKYFYTYNVEHGTVQKVPYIRGYQDERSLENFTLSPDDRVIAFQCNYGYIPLIDSRSKHWIGELKMNNSVRSTAWSADGSMLYSFGSDSEVYVWDVGSRQCIAKHIDDSGVHGTCISVSHDSRYYATGSDSGVVSIYSVDQLQQYADNQITKMIPLKQLENIVTPIDEILFNHDTQLLCATSRRSKDVLKMYNINNNFASFTNWPASNTPLHYVTATSFSPHSGYMAIGNDRGRVLLYRLRQYSRA